MEVPAKKQLSQLSSGGGGRWGQNHYKILKNHCSLTAKWGGGGGEGGLRGGKNHYKKKINKKNQ